MLLRQIFDPTLAQYAYLVGCQKTGEALVVDPERDIDRYLEAAAAEGLRITMVAETHIHADFLSGARDLAIETGANLVLSSEGGPDWSYRWPRDNAGTSLVSVTEGDAIWLGNIQIRVLHTPGHTPEHIAFLLTDGGASVEEPIALLSGDFLFVGDLGRPDLLESAAGEVGAMEPAAQMLFESTATLKKLAPYVQVWPGHGAGSACGKALGAMPSTTVGYELRHNSALKLVELGEDAFVAGILEGQPEPPMYFSRMKVQNRDGVPSPSPIEAPRRWSAEAVVARAIEKRVTVIDARRDHRAFLKHHLKGSLWAPWGASFLAYAGSYVEPEDPMVLVAEEAIAAHAARALYRIGLDEIEGWVDPRELESYLKDHEESLASIPSVGWEAVRSATEQDRVLDVRRRAEYQAGAVPGASNVAHTRLAGHWEEFSEGHTIVHCLSGMRATAACAYLASKGSHVTHVDAHFKDWPA